MNAIELTEIAWAAGFFDGEGWVGAALVTKTKRATAAFWQVRCEVNQVRVEPLDRFLEAVQVGAVHGPYLRRTIPNSQPYYRWTTAGVTTVASVLTTLWPFLSLPKREQATRVWHELRLHRPPSKQSPLPMLSFEGQLAFEAS